MPGPHSAMRVAPRAASACTQPVHAPAGTAGARARRGSTARRRALRRRRSARPGDPARDHASAAIASAKRLAASRISGVCEGTLTASFTALRTPRVGEQRERAIDRGGVAADHDLARRVEVGGHDDVVARGLLADFEHQRVFGAEHGGHRAGAGGRGVLHQLAAHAHELRAVVQRERAGGDQRGVFAEAVAGEQRRLRAAARLPRAPRGDAGGEQRGLREFGLVELVFRALLRERPQVDARAFGGFVERGAHAARAAARVRRACRPIASPGRETRRRVGGCVTRSPVAKEGGMISAFAARRLYDDVCDSCTAAYGAAHAARDQ